jgi:hypothetical protein
MPIFAVARVTEEALSPFASKCIAYNRAGILFARAGESYGFFTRSSMSADTPPHHYCC